jgi:hypothetical protein
MLVVSLLLQQIHVTEKEPYLILHPESESHYDVASGFFYVVRTVRFGMKFYNDQCNAQVFNLFIYKLLPYMFRTFF